MVHCELFDLDHMLFGHGFNLGLVVLLEGGEGRGEILLGSGLSLGQILKVGFMRGFEVGELLIVLVYELLNLLLGLRFEGGRQSLEFHLEGFLMFHLQNSLLLLVNLHH